MRVRTVLAIVIIVFLIAFFIVPIAGGKQGPTTPGTGRVQRLPDAGQPYTPLFDEGISIVGDPALKADNVPVPANYDIERDITFPARAGTGGGDMPEFEPNNVMSFANTATDIPFTCTGTIDAAGDMDWIRVFVTAGEPLQISVHSRIGLFMSPLNPFLDVRRQDGSLLAFNDNISWPDNLNAEVYITPTYTGDIVPRRVVFGASRQPCSQVHPRGLADNGTDLRLQQRRDRVERHDVRSRPDHTARGQDRDDLGERRRRLVVF
ncbi:MAG: hypothetical protein IPF53_09330 [Blastocatellia bacterium]|nr:hypothetical protein [Blastocatellia bacterium]